MEYTIIKLKKDENNIIDVYNKNRMLMNILNRLVLRLKSEGNEEDIVSFYDEMNSLFLIENKFLVREEINNNLAENISNLVSKSFQDDMFPSLLFLDKDDFRNFVDEDKGVRNFNSFSIENLKLLSLFEEEIRKFLKRKKEISERLKCKLNDKQKESISYDDNLTSDSRKNLFSLKLEKSTEEIFNKLLENFELINDIFLNFKNTQTHQETRELLSFQTNFDSMKNMIEKMMNSITEELSGEKSIMVLHKLKVKLSEENNKLSNEINELKVEINRFSEEGDELIELVKEYKKICNMIECRKK